MYIDILARAFDSTYETSGHKVAVDGLEQILSDLHLVSASAINNGKGKGRLDHPSDWIVDWFPGYLASIKDLDSHRLIHAKKEAPPSVEDLAFSDAMASTMGFFMQTLQPRRFAEDFRATAIVWGFRVSRLHLNPMRIIAERIPSRHFPLCVQVLRLLALL